MADGSRIWQIGHFFFLLFLGVMNLVYLSSFCHMLNDQFFVGGLRTHRHSGL